MRGILFYEVKVLIHPPVRPCSHTPVSVLTHLHTPVSNPIFLHSPVSTEILYLDGALDEAASIPE